MTTGHCSLFLLADAVPKDEGCMSSREFVSNFKGNYRYAVSIDEEESGNNFSSVSPAFSASLFLGGVYVQK